MAAPPLWRDPSGFRNRTWSRAIPRCCSRTGVACRRQEHATLAIDAAGGLSWWPCEDGVDLLVTLADADHTRGGAKARERRHLEQLRAFPATIDSGELDAAERLGEVRAAPEPMLRDFFRQATGAGWALVGDAGHFKHPGTAQGIGDAIEQAFEIATRLTGADPELRGYGPWRDQHAADHYEWSFTFGRLPREATTGPIADGLQHDTTAAQAFRDTFTRHARPSEALSPARLQEWFTTVGR